MIDCSNQPQQAELQAVAVLSRFACQVTLCQLLNPHACGNQHTTACLVLVAACLGRRLMWLCADCKCTAALVAGSIFQQSSSINNACQYGPLQCLLIKVDVPGSNGAMLT